MRVLLADGLTAFRAAARSVLEREPEVEVVEAETLSAAIAAAADGSVDVVLIDHDVLPPSALHALRMFRADGRTRVIVWRFEPDPVSVLDAIRAGADGYLSKQIASDELVGWLHRAANGEAVLPPALMPLMIDALHALDERELEQAPTRKGLSAREREVLAEVARGARNREIAQRLAISEFTVKRHIQNILHKLELGSRREAAAFYRAVYDRVAGPGAAALNDTAPVRAPREMAFQVEP